MDSPALESLAPDGLMRPHKQYLFLYPDGKLSMGKFPSSFWIYARAHLLAKICADRRGAQNATARRPHQRLCRSENAFSNSTGRGRRRHAPETFCILFSLATVPGPQRHPGGLTIGQAASRGHGSAQQLIPTGSPVAVSRRDCQPAGTTGEQGMKSMKSGALPGSRSAAAEITRQQRRSAASVLSPQRIMIHRNTFCQKFSQDPLAHRQHPEPGPLGRAGREQPAGCHPQCMRRRLDERAAGPGIPAGRCSPARRHGGGRGSGVALKGSPDPSARLGCVLQDTFYATCL